MLSIRYVSDQVAGRLFQVFRSWGPREEMWAGKKQRKRGRGEREVTLLFQFPALWLLAALHHLNAWKKAIDQAVLQSSPVRPIISYSRGSSKNSFYWGLSNMIVSPMNFYLGKEGGSKEKEGEIRGSPTPAETLQVISNWIFKIPVERF